MKNELVLKQRFMNKIFFLSLFNQPLVKFSGVRSTK